MHVRGHALAGSLLQLEAAAKACRMELQGGSLNYRWRDYVVGSPHGFGSGCTSRPSMVLYASVASGEKMWDSRLSCNSTNKLKHSESCLLATIGNTLWVLQDITCEQRRESAETWAQTGQKSGGQVQLYHAPSLGAWFRHASVMQCQVFIKSPTEYLKYECELF